MHAIGIPSPPLPFILLSTSRPAGLGPAQPGRQARPRCNAVARVPAISWRAADGCSAVGAHARLGVMSPGLPVRLARGHVYRSPSIPTLVLRGGFVPPTAPPGSRRRMPALPGDPAVLCRGCGRPNSQPCGALLRCLPNGPEEAPAAPRAARGALMIACVRPCCNANRVRCVPGVRAAPRAAPVCFCRHVLCVLECTTIAVHKLASPSKLVSTPQHPFPGGR